MALIECVPNVSEGRDPQILEAIGQCVATSPGCHLLHRDSGAAAHRSVFTFVGEPQAVAEGAFRLIEAASHNIDMRAHHGVHPRIGATDVCPFVPLEGSSLEECRKLAAQVGRRVGNELDLPVYLYGDGAPDLAELRRGQYEGLADRLASGQLPQFGPPELRPRFGALAIGAREVLVAYNIDLDSKDARLAGRIAARIRGSGYLHNGVRIPGRFATLRAIGWYIEEYGNAQVSMNVGDYRVDSLLSIFTAVESLAHEMGCSVLSSELIGLSPRAALPDESGQSLRLRDFDPELRILERCVERSLRG